MYTYRRDIDGLRALAVVPVVFSHAGLPGFSGGFVGVDVFFVISGFLISGILMREIEAGNFSLIRFYERRARRILPALFVVLTVVLAVGYFVLTPWEYKDLSKSMIATIFFVSNFWFLESTSGYFGSAAEYEPLLHTWSLAVEEQFYIFFPLILWWLSSRKKTTVIAFIALISAASLALSVWATHAYPLHNFFWIPTRIWELGVGALLAMGAFKASRHKILVELVSAAGFLAICASIFFITDATPFPGLTALPVCLGTVAIIWGGMQHQTIVSSMLATPGAVGIGLISYSFYLWHWPPLVFARIITGASELPISLALFLIILSAICAYLSWRFVERPFRKGSSGKQLTQPQIFRLSGISSLIITAACFIVYSTDGLLGRLSSQSVLYYQDAINMSDSQRRCKDEFVCVVGDAEAAGSKPTYFLWGDSHASAMLVGYERWLESKGLVGAAAAEPGCPPLFDLVRRTRNGITRCDVFNRNVLAYIEDNHDIQNVILVGRWAVAAHGTLTAGEAGPDVILDLSPDSKAALPDPGNAAAFEFGFQSTVDRLLALGKTITVIESVPEIGYNVPQSFTRHDLIGTVNRKVPTRADFDERNRLPLSIMANVLQDKPVRTVSVADIVCRPDCLVQLDNRSLYRDDDHLSAWGAIWLFPKLFP